MNHGLSRGGPKAESKSGVGVIDLGHEPPLSVDGSEAGVIDRRRVSVQWFSGTILTGLCGAALIGGAVFASLDGETTFASLPEKVESVLRGAIGSHDRGSTVRKSDRLPPPSESASARQVIRVSTATRVGTREVMRVRPYIRVGGNLALTTSELSSRIPPFNAQRLLTDIGSAVVPTEDAQAADAEPDAEISFVTRDLAAVLPRMKIAGALPVEEIEMNVREIANWRGQEGVRYAVASINPVVTAAGLGQGGIKMAYAAEGKIDPYAGFETRIVPENVTQLPKKLKDQTTAAGGAATNERNYVVKKGDTLVSVLRDQGATVEEARAIVGTLGLQGRDGALREGQKLRILMAAPSPGKRLQPMRVIVSGDTAVEAIVALSDLGKYVSVDVQSFNSPTETAKAADDDDDDENESGVRLYQSIYETAMRDKVPMPVIEDMIKIYSYDVDFQRRAQAGDSFEVFYAGEDETPNPDSKNEVLFAALTVDGETKKYYRFQTDDGVVDYYDETGKSAKKFLVRKPVTNGIMRSGFGGRRHPILGYAKMHTGVDWAAPFGTPIFASGNGTVEKVGWEGGYGKFVMLKHPNGYETAYGHMTAYAKGIEPGKSVRQGQVIGFVGSTGLSTGAHVHYEIRVNGRFVDPMRIRLPRGRSLEGGVLAGFEQERDRLDTMMNRSPARVAQSQGQGQTQGSSAR